MCVCRECREDALNGCSCERLIECESCAQERIDDEQSLDELLGDDFDDPFDGDDFDDPFDGEDDLADPYEEGWSA